MFSKDYISYFDAILDNVTQQLAVMQDIPGKESKNPLPKESRDALMEIINGLYKKIRWKDGTPSKEDLAWLWKFCEMAEHNLKIRYQFARQALITLEENDIMGKLQAVAFNPDSNNIDINSLFIGKIKLSKDLDRLPNI